MRCRRGGRQSHMPPFSPGRTRGALGPGERAAPRAGAGLRQVFADGNSKFKNLFEAEKIKTFFASKAPALSMSLCPRSGASAVDVRAGAETTKRVRGSSSALRTCKTFMLKEADKHVRAEEPQKGKNEGLEELCNPGSISAATAAAIRYAPPYINAAT